MTVVTVTKLVGGYRATATLDGECTATFQTTC
jgi:hypothetical protein